MQFFDYVVMALYAAGMLAIGWYYSRRTTTAAEYHLGSRQMSPILIGMSLFATLVSTLSYLAYPGEMVKNGPMIFAQLTAFPVAMIVVGWWLIPAIMKQQNITSGYQLLELRLGLTGRLLGAGMFVALRTFWMASILYATADKVVVPLFNLNPAWAPVAAVVMGVLTVVYTALGGLRAVVITDALQSLIMCFGAILTIIVVTVLLGGFNWFPRAWPDHWQEPVFWFRADVRVTFMGAFLNMVVWMICTSGSDQMAIQRYLATRDASSARQSFAVHLFMDVLIAGLLALVGLAVLGYFTLNQGAFGTGGALIKDADKLFPRFVAIGLPVGISGLVIAAILSAAMSSLSSGMNSSSAVITSDFINRFRTTDLGHHEQIRLARIVSVVVGVIAIALSTVVGGLAANLLELCIKGVNLLTAPIFVLFFLALFVRWATPLGGAAATIASVSVAVGIAFFQLFGLEFLWTAPCSLLTGIVVGMLVSLLPGGSQESGVRKQESGVRSQGAGVRSQETGITSRETGIKRPESGIRSRETGIKDEPPKRERREHDEPESDS